MGGTGRKKIEIKKIENPAARMVTFTKRRQGLFKKAKELELMTGSIVASIAFSPTGRPYIYGDVHSAVERHFSGKPTESSLSNPEVVISGESSGSKKNTLHVWVESIDVERCENRNQLMLLKGQLEGARDKLASQDSEAFLAYFA